MVVANALQLSVAAALIAGQLGFDIEADSSIV
jgi:hypothetical protein